MPYSLSRLSMWTIIAALPLTFLSQLPDAKYDWVLMVTGTIFLACRQQWLKEGAILLLLFLWMITPGRELVRQIHFLSARPLEATVIIDQVQPLTERMRVRIVQAAEQPFFSPIYAQLSLKNIPQKFCGGQRWKMRLRLRPVHARLNEGGFDSQRFALANSMPLTGKILSMQPVNSSCGWREKIIESRRQKYDGLPWQAVISALAFGDRGEMSTEIKTLLRETGTAHLMAISGMHIGLAASLGWLITRLLQLCFRAHWIGYRLPLAGSLVMALIYSWMSGGSAPAMRAILALITWSLLRLKGRCCTNWQVWALCIAVIVFFDPLSMLSDSLWLSAVAVAGLLFWYQWFPLPARFMAKKRWLLLRLLHLQTGLFLLLMPVQIMIFHGISLSALLANLWAVPLVTLLTVPLILCAILLDYFNPLSSLLWWAVDQTLMLVFRPLQALPAGWIFVDREGLWLSMLAWLILATGRFGWWRTSPFAVIGLCLSVGCWRLNIRQPEWRLDMLDVGHGLAVAISQQGKATLYDTGNQWIGGDAALSHILPWLRWQGLTVQHIVLSHGHLDHIGGLESLQTAFPQAVIHSGLNKSGHLPCHQGVSWRWQSLRFQAIWPRHQEPQAGNNQSCVVAVTDGKWRVLLTGDIEAPAELEIVKLYRSALQAEVIQVPHHGSGTSSMPPLLRSVGGKAALASAARYSAWKFPADRIISRYKENGYQWYDTAADGQVRIEFFNENWRVLRLRAQIMSRWYHQWFGVPR